MTNQIERVQGLNDNEYVILDEIDSQGISFIVVSFIVVCQLVVSHLARTKFKIRFKERQIGYPL